MFCKVYFVIKLWFLLFSDITEEIYKFTWKIKSVTNNGI